MTLKVREVLDIIDGVLAGGAQDARELWNILTALRGPDDDGDDWLRKGKTTVHIRAAAFPKTARSADFEQATMKTDVKYDPTPGTKLHDWHFFGHIDRAADALGLVPEPQVTA